jgi:hypothetical protein
LFRCVFCAGLRYISFLCCEILHILSSVLFSPIPLFSGQLFSYSSIHSRCGFPDALRINPLLFFMMVIVVEVVIFLIARIGTLLL